MGQDEGVSKKKQQNQISGGQIIQKSALFIHVACFAKKLDFKMAAGSLIGFGLTENSASIFARVLGSEFTLNTQKMPNQS